DQLGLRVCVLDALLEAARELANERDVHATDEADLAALRRHRGEKADQERALMLLEQHRLHVRKAHDAVDEGKADLREFLCDLLDRVRLVEADADDRVLTALSETAMRLLELRLVRDLEFGVALLGLLLEFLGADIDPFVEG